MFGAVRYWSIAPLMLLAYMGALMMFARPLVFRATVPLSIPPATVPALAFLVYVAAAIPMAIAPYEAALRALMIGSAVASYWVIAGLAGRGGRWKFLLTLLLALIALNAAYAAMQHLQGSRMMLGVERHPSYLMRMGGTYNCPNHFANLLAIAIAFSLAVLFAKEIGWTLKVMAVYALGMTAWPLALSQSRSGFAVAVGGGAVSLLLVAWRKGVRQSVFALVAIPLLAAAALGVVWAKAPDLRGRLERSSTDLQTRILVWKGTADMARDAPVLGHGGGSFRLLDSKYVDIPPTGAAVHAHNDYLHVAAEYGLVGLGLALLMAGTWIVRMLVLLRRSRKESNSLLAAGAVGAVAACLAQALVDFNFHIYANSMTLVLIAGCVASLFHASGDLPNPLPKPWRGRWIAAAGSLAAGFAIALVVRSSVAYAWTEYRGHPAMDAGRWTEAEAAFRTALRWDPRAWEPILGLCRTAVREADMETDPEKRSTLIERASSLCEEGLRRNPREPGFEHNLSHLLMMKGDAEGSVNLLRKILADHRNRPVLQARLGIQLERMGRLEESLEAFREAARMDPQNQTIRMYRNLMERRVKGKAAPPTTP